MRVEKTMSVRETEDEVEEHPISDEEARKRLRKLAWEQPDFNYSILEALMDYMGLTIEQQWKIITEGVKKWQQT